MIAMLRRLVCGGLILLIAATTVLADSTGKIVGKVTDAQTGEAIIGANILVVGTQRGAVTDIDGKYTIIAVPGGNVTVRASILGYATAEVRDLKIGVDQTSTLDFRLTSS